MANLGDGNGPQPQIFELREDFGNVETGVCIEQLIGGNHFRSVRVADLNYVYMFTEWHCTEFTAKTENLRIVERYSLRKLRYGLKMKSSPMRRVSSELNVLHNHTISADGYNRGR